MARRDARSASNAHRPSLRTARARSNMRRDRGFTLPVRYAVLAHRLGDPRARPRAGPPTARGRWRRRATRRADLRAAQGARSIAATPRVSPRAGIGSCHGVNARAGRRCSISSTPRMRCAVRSASTHLLQTCECDAMSAPRAVERFCRRASHLRAALDVVKGVDAGAIARAVSGQIRRIGDGAVGSDNAGAFARRGWRRCARGTRRWRDAASQPRESRRVLDAVGDESHHVRGDAHQALHRKRELGARRRPAPPRRGAPRRRAFFRRWRGSSRRLPAGAPCASSDAPRPGVRFRRRIPG